MTRVTIIGGEGGIACRLIARLCKSSIVEWPQHAPERKGSWHALPSTSAPLFSEPYTIDTVVYFPALRQEKLMVPDLIDAESVFKQCVGAQIRKAVVLSSAAVYGASWRNAGLVGESHPPPRNGKNRISGPWLELENLAKYYLSQHGHTQLTILRPVPVLAPGAADYFRRLFGGRVAFTLPGHDPSIQLLSPDDLADAVCCAVERSKDGVFNVAPDGVITLRAALRLARSTRIPVPRMLQRAGRLIPARLGLSHPVEQLEFIRYSWTVSNRKIKSELGFVPQHSSAAALKAFVAAKRGKCMGERNTRANLRFDDFGMDPDYISKYGRALFHFLSRYYWRIEVNGLGYVPRKGRGVLVGMHRGFMPWDGVMALHLIVQNVGRIPRFLIHPGLVKFPFLSNFMTKLGGIIACKENGEYVLERDELLGVFPEGIRGAFTLYREAYKLGDFGRNDFVKMALRHRAPIIPFVTVGSAEIFPILGRIPWRLWTRYTEWPFFPLTPTFPLAPFPLPSKWHTKFLEPLHVEQLYPPEAAQDPRHVRAIAQMVRDKMEEAIHRILQRRKSIFFGSVFEAEAG